MKKTNKLLLLAYFILFIGLCLIVIISTPKIFGYVISPKIEGIRYTHTTYENLEVRCIVAHCPPLKHHYIATGTEKEIMEQIVKNLNKDNYIFEPGHESSWVMCDQYGPDITDSYRLFKLDDYYRYPHTLDIDLKSNTEYMDENPQDIIGCDRLRNTYHISMSSDKAHCVVAKSTHNMCYEEGSW